jgi:hypothetical protein
LFAISVGIAPASAQAQPIAVGENKTGEVSAAVPAAEFSLSVPAPQTVRVQVLAITAGFAPFFTVTDTTNGIPLASVGVSGESTIVQGDVTLAPGVTYVIQVQSANGVLGEFVLSVQPGPAVQPPIPLTIGQPVSDQVSTESPSRQYSFTADPLQILLLNVSSDDPATGLSVRLRDGATGETLAANSARLIGTRFRIPSGPENYVVEVAHGGSETDEAYTVCLEIEGGTVPCPGSGPAPTPVPTETPLPTVPNFVAIPIPSNGPCSLAPAGASAVNVRGGPSTSTPIVTQLAPNTIVPVIGRLADNSWYQVNVGGLVGWVSATVARIGGNNCNTVTIINTPTPTATGTTNATATASATPSATTNATATASATASPSPTATVGAVPTLNYSLPPVYGSTALTSGFVPDPFSVGVTAGGPANSNYIGGGCYGYTTSAPTFSVNYTSGAFPTLRFYFMGGGDTTMIINSPSGSYFCVDDSFGTLNPTIDFNSPSSGRYDIWVATYAQGASIGGTLYVTENTGNHP